MASATVLDINASFQQALTAMERGDHLFVTGKAGTGKSTLLSYFRERTEKKVVVLAPTGVAALHVQGQTIHSFFRFKANVNSEDAQLVARRIKNKDLYTNIDTIIIDEISMVRADLLDCVDVFLQTVLRTSRAFGGIQMVFIGDLYQLPPVVVEHERVYFNGIYESPYFFSAKVVQRPDFVLNYVELHKIYRQNDCEFLDVLNAVRHHCLEDKHLEVLNTRVASAEELDEEHGVHLVTTNREADAINAARLKRLRGQLFLAEAQIAGDFDVKSAPADMSLAVKIGARVMMLTNDVEGRWVNGTLGEVVAVEQESSADGAPSIVVRTQSGSKVYVEPYEWSMYEYIFDEEQQLLRQKNKGSFWQYPLKLAWAMTIHKSQGKTFDRVMVDLGRVSFAHGQTYVALSRCRSLEGLMLKRPMRRSHIVMDERVQQFLTTFQESKR